MLLSAPRISFLPSSLWEYHHPSSDKFLYQSCWCLSWGLAGFGQGWEHLGSLCICLGVPLKHVWGVRVTNEFVCSVRLVSTGPMCVDRASTHTAVQAGRPCREGTSALFVSGFFVCGMRGMALCRLLSPYKAEDVDLTCSVFLQQSAGIHAAMASAPDLTCAPVPAVSSLPTVDQEQEVSNLHLFSLYIH